MVQLGVGEVGLVHRHPACGGQNTFWSCLHNSWYCEDCGETFDPLGADFQVAVDEQRSVVEWMEAHPEEVARIKEEHGL